MSADVLSDDELEVVVADSAVDVKSVAASLKTKTKIKKMTMIETDATRRMDHSAIHSPGCVLFFLNGCDTKSLFALDWVIANFGDNFLSRRRNYPVNEFLHITSWFCTQIKIEEARDWILSRMD